jgi:hypothetical protein
MAVYQDVLSQVESLTADEQLQLLEDLAALVRQRVRSDRQQVSELTSDPLVGLFGGSIDLATKSEDILQQEITEKSG